MIRSVHGRMQTGNELRGIWSSLARLTLDRLLALFLFISVFIMAIRPPADTDTWWHLSVGRYIVQRGHIPLADVFSYTVQGKSWVNPQWLGQIGLYGIYRNLGMAGLAIFLGIVVTLTFAFVYKECRGDPYLRAFAILLAALTSSIVWVARPQVFSLLLTAILLRILSLFKRNGLNRLWWIPIIVCLWANLHGAFVVAFILQAAFILGEVLNNVLGVGNERILKPREIGTLLIIASASIPATLLNPNTYKLWSLPFYTVGMRTLREAIEEWASPNFHRLSQQPYLWLVLCLLCAVALSRGKMDFTDLILTILFAYMGFMAVRNVAFFALIAPPIVTRYGTDALNNLQEAWHARTAWGAGLEKLLTHRFAQTRLLVVTHWVMAGLILLVGLGRVASFVFSPNLASSTAGPKLPVQAVDYIESHDPPRQLFNPYHWGGYLMWRLGDRYPVFLDGRTDLYDDSIIEQASRVENLIGSWEAILSNYQVNSVLTERASLLDRGLDSVAGWRRVYSDDVASVFVRSAK